VVEIGQEENLLLGRNRLDHRANVARGAAVVALGLDRRGGVDVGDDHGAGMLRLPGPQLTGVDRFGKRAAGREVGNQDGLLGRENLRCLGHEVNATEHDCPALGTSRFAREPERVAHEVGDVLNLGQLVVVGEDHRLSRARERPNLILQRLDEFASQGSSTSSETSRERAEWVRAPIEIAFTPVSA
jgi:hypothetical protein